MTTSRSTRGAPLPARRLLAGALAAAVVVAIGACSSAPNPAFDLTAPRQTIRGGGAVGGQLVVAEPVGVQALEDQRILVRDAAGSVSFLGGVQWADRLPRLLQARLIQTFENSSRIRAVGRPSDGLAATAQLNTEIRAFQLEAGQGEVVVEISAKLVSVASSRIVAARVFTGRLAVPSADGPIVAQALDRALSPVLLDIVRWAGPSR